MNQGEEEWMDELVNEYVRMNSWMENGWMRQYFF